MDASQRHLIGLLLGSEEDWPLALEAIVRRLGPVRTADGRVHEFDTERLTIEPFRLTDPVRAGLVIDRLAYWYYHPREWLKKAALVDETYLVNNPFTFQSMEKHSAYCALLRLGLPVPPTVLVPYKEPVDNVRWAYTSAKYNRVFDLGAIAAELGYPLYLKPFDGGGWRGVARIENESDLHRSYDESGRMLMHLQAAVPHEYVVRALSIGPETIVMRYQPDRPPHDRYVVSHDFLSPTARRRVVAMSRLVGSFFGWELNTSELLVDGDTVVPIDVADPCPELGVTALHYYFPWAIKALVRWSVYCLATGRRQRVEMCTERYYAIADDPTLDEEERLAAYLALADEQVETDRYWEWCEAHLPQLDEQVLDWVDSTDFDRVLRESVGAAFPTADQSALLDHYHGLVERWVVDESTRLRKLDVG